MDVLAIERRHKRLEKTMNDVTGQRVAGVLDALDLIRLAPGRRRAGEHLLEQDGRVTDMFGKRNKV